MDQNSTNQNPAAMSPTPGEMSTVAPVEPANDSTTMPPPNATITPTAPPLKPESTSTYLESSTPPMAGAAIADSGNSFLATGSGAPAISSGSSAAPAATAIPPAAADDLMKIKTKALQSLAPLIDKLDQPPEERFKTLMMMIQASDNPQYLDEAYDAAGRISDAKTRAQALLDVVNEINYFTQHASK